MRSAQRLAHTLAAGAPRAHTLAAAVYSAAQLKTRLAATVWPGVDGCVSGGAPWWFTDGYFRSRLAAVFSHAHCPGDRRVARPNTLTAVRGVRVECRENARSRSRRVRVEWPQPSGLPRHMRATVIALSPCIVAHQRAPHYVGIGLGRGSRSRSRSNQRTSSAAFRLATCYSSSSTVFSIPCR